MARVVQKLRPRSALQTNWLMRGNMHRRRFDDGRLDLDRLRQELRLAPYKALVTIILATVACMGIILAVARVIH